MMIPVTWAVLIQRRLNAPFFEAGICQRYWESPFDEIDFEACQKQLNIRSCFKPNRTNKLKYDIIHHKAYEYAFQS